jgi:hypothetical protein
MQENMVSFSQAAWSKLVRLALLTKYEVLYDYSKHLRKQAGFSPRSAIFERGREYLHYDIASHNVFIGI